MTFEELEKLVADAPVSGRSVSVDNAHALIVAILVEVREIRKALEEMRSR